MHLTRNTKQRCVMARIARQKIRHQANFTLKQYGSWSAASAAAAKWVQKTLPTLPPIITTKGVMGPRNSSGCVGVNLTSSTYVRIKGNRFRYWRWVARWPGCPLNGGLSWSTERFGAENAFVLAVLTRRAESIDREMILSELKRIEGSKQYKKILKLKQGRPSKPKRR